jgi:hypothetical protein
MKVIWHGDKFIFRDIGEMIGDFFQDNPWKPPKFVQMHFTINQVPEQAFTVFGDNGDEVCAG